MRIVCRWGVELHGLISPEVNHNRVPVQAPILAQERGVYEESVGRPQRAVSSMDMPEHMEPRPRLENCLPQLGTALAALRAWTVVKDAERRAVGDEDVQAFRNPRPVLLERVSGEPFIFRMRFDT